MKSHDFAVHTVRFEQGSEQAALDRRGRKIMRKVGTAAVAVLSGAGAAISVSQAPSSAAEHHSAKHVHIDKETSKHAHKATKHRHHDTSKTIPTTTTTTTIPPQVKDPSGEFLGAIELIRKGAQETDPADANVYHRINNGMWQTTPTGILTVNPNPMLSYGAVFNQNTAAVGTIGETTVIAMHDVTPLYAPVTVNGITYNQQEATHSFNVDPSAGIGNLEDGDQIKLYLNNTNATETVYTYNIVGRYVINASINAQVQELAAPPSNSANSQLVLYDCWPPGGELYREANVAELADPPAIVPGTVTYPGSEPPIYNTANG